jgi:hypothetical protein
MERTVAKTTTNQAKKTTEQKGTPVLVTTEHRGVFFGYLLGEPSKEKVLLRHVRNCVFWSADAKGFVGLAEKGPTRGCRVGPPAPEATLFDITSVITCTEEAVDAWEKSPWA